MTDDDEAWTAPTVRKSAALITSASHSVNPMSPELIFLVNPMISSPILAHPPCPNLYSR